MNSLPEQAIARPLVVHINKLKISGFISPCLIANFLGVKYASIPRRFGQAKLVPLDTLTGTIEATEYGPICPQPVDKPRVEREHLYRGIRPLAGIPPDEFECLCVNVYVPPKSLEENSGARLPVFAWLHGGGWTVGDGNNDYDGNFLVRKSMELGKPIVYVGINYRVGFYGFLSSRELEAEAKENHEEYFSNQGLHDQRLALLWIQRYIGYFGGDVSNVTIAGESAGAWCVLAHLLTDVPVCQRAMIMSAPTWEPSSPTAAQQIFDRLVTSTGLTNAASNPEKLAALRNIPTDQIEQLLNGGIVRPTWDPQWFHYQTGALFPGKTSNFPEWVKGIVTGWTKDEIALWGLHWRSWSPQRIQTLLKRIIPDERLAEKVAEAYGISDNSASSQATGLLAFGTDSIFGNLPFSFNSASSLPISIYRFDQVDTHETSPFKSYAYHSLDNAYICRLPAVAGPEAPLSSRATADALTTAACDFAYGEQPWVPFKGSGQIKLFDGNHSRLVDWPSTAVWTQFTTTPEGVKLFRAAGMDLIRERNFPG